MEFKVDETIGKSVTTRFDKTNVRESVLVEGTDLHIRLSFYWDSHGRMIPWNGGPKSKKTFSCRGASAKITKEEFTMMDRDWEMWNLEVNGKKIAGEVYEYRLSNSILTVKLAVGSG